MEKSRPSKIRAPHVDGAYLVSPVARIDSLLEENCRRLAQAHANQILRLNPDELESRRAEARQQMLDAAIDYVGRYAPDTFSKSIKQNQLRIIMTGHQPEFFHPGVWFKNFLAAKLGQACNGIGVNLIVDNDICLSRSITVPTGTIENPARVMIPYDAMGMHPSGDSQVVPYEIASWNDPSSTQSFQVNARGALASLFQQPTILDEIWDQLIEIQSSCSNLGETISRTRHLYELDQQVRNLEVPLSAICKTDSFRRFLLDIVSHAEPFQKLYNESLDEFRIRNRVRSQSHPVPRLIKSEGWIELPFWIWTTDSPWRGPLYVKPKPGRIALTDLDQIQCEIELNGNSLNSFRTLDQQGVAIRPRALMTTMFARVFLADTFVHGIGGAKYDELTDAIIESFYGTTPPEFVTASSTHWLPLGISPNRCLRHSAAKTENTLT